MPRRARALLLLALLQLPLGACGRPPAPAVPPRTIVWIVVDTLRADHVPAYGYPRATLPVASKLAARGVLFERAYTPLPETTPAFASMLTGLLPHRTGVVRLYNLLPPEVETVPRRLRAAGWETGAFVSSFVLVRSFSGLDRGFDTYDDFVDERERNRDNFERRAGATLDRAAAWLERDGEKPRFALVHLIDPHGPYDPPADLARRFRSPRSREVDGVIPEYQAIPGVRDLYRYVDLYDGEIALVDRELELFLARLRAASRLSRALVVLTADHGESFGEHGPLFQHGSDVHEENVRVPLVVVPPEGGGFVRGAVVEEPVFLPDLAPTVLELAGLAPPAGLDGRSLRGALSGEPLPRRPLLLCAHPDGGAAWALVEGKLKTVLEPARSALYDLAADPGERSPRPAPPDRLERLAALSRELSTLRLPFESRNNFLELGKREEFLRRRGQAGRDDVGRLRSLGYLR